LLSAPGESKELLRTKNYKGGIVSDTHSENRFLISRRQQQDRNLFSNIKKSPATLCLALLLISGFAHADDNALVREANAALAQKDYSGAFSKFSVLAERGNAIAQFDLGAFYLNGQGVQRDEKQAYEWFTKSAAQGNATALQVINKAAAKGNENAKAALNKLQQQTASPPAQAQAPAQPATPVVADNQTLWVEANAALAQKDYKTAFPKFLTLAQQGNAMAQFNVGAFYFNGLGVQKDEKLAYDWFGKSAAQGNVRAEQVMKSAETKREETAKKTREAQAQAAAAAASKPEVKAQEPVFRDITSTKTATAPSHARSKRSDESSAPKFSVGLSLGQTGKMTGVNNSSSIGLLAGYKFNSSFGVEVAYNSLYRNANADGLVAALYPGTTGTYDLTSLSAAGQYTYGLSSNVSLLGNLGFHTSSYKVKSSANGSWTGSSSGLLLGLKVQYDLSKNLGIRGGFDTYTESGGITGNLTEVGMSVVTKF
jgi:TPR repeat protein